MHRGAPAAGGKRLASDPQLRVLCKLAVVFRRPLHEVLDWPAWEAALLAEYLSHEPCGDDRTEIAVAQLAAIYVNAHRQKGAQPRRISDFLLFHDAWKSADEEPAESLDAFALSLGAKRVGNDHS